LLIETPHRGWTDTLVRAGFAALLTTGTALVVAERRRRQPLLDLALFARPAFTAGVLGAAAVFVGLAATLLLSTYHLQVGRGWTPLESGLALLPLAAGAAFCAPLSGIMVSRDGPRRPLLIAGTALALGGVLLGVAGTRTAPLAILLAAYGVLGVGIGFANAPITTTAVSGLPRERTGVAAAITSTARQVGSAMGIAAAGALVSGGSPDLSPGWLLPAGSGLVLLVVAVVPHRPAS
jgi:MFS family permease